MQTIPTAPKDPSRKKDKGTQHFWRACRFLYPYRNLVLISIICAVFVGGANTAGLGTILPVMHVLVKGDTIAGWADREIAQKRLQAHFSDDSIDLMVTNLKRHGAAASAGLRANDIIVLPDGQENHALRAAPVLAQLADPLATSTEVTVRGRGKVVIQLPAVPPYLAAAQRVARAFPTHPVKAIGLIFGGITILSIFASFMGFFQEYLSDKAAIKTVNDIRRRLYDHALHVPLRHFNLSGTSDITSRLTQDAQGLSEGYKTVLGQSIQEPLKAAMAFGMALFISWRLTLFIVLFAPLMLMIVKKFGKKMRRASKKALVSSAGMLGQIEASLAGIRVVKGANAERFERRRYTRIMDRLIDEQLRMSRIDNVSTPILATMNLLVSFMVVLVASYMISVQQSLEFADFCVLMACLASIGDSLRRVSKVNNVLQRANAAAARIFEIIDLPIEKKGWHSSATGHRLVVAPEPSSNGDRAEEHRPRLKLQTFEREVRFENVTFAYPGAQSNAITNLSLTVPRGKCVAIVGRNGSGKTTLLALLPRFYDPQAGRVLVDGVDVRDLTLKSLRDQISLVTQDSVIFPGTVAENIAYGHPLASAPVDSKPGRELRERVIDAAKRAFAHEFIMDKPQGYDTLLGGLGAQLSGGQKQRICIARAVLRKSPILVLDEATSQVDAESEDKIQQALDGLMHERTTFVIAHRFSTIVGADEIIVLDRGQIVGQGKHISLLEMCPTYRQLYEKQLVSAQ